MSTFSDYLKSIEAGLQRGDATEHTHRTALKILLEALGDNIVATNEPKHSKFGAPDFNVSRGGLTIGYAETKDVNDPLTQTQNTEQLKRYRSHIENLLLTDYLEFRWYVDGELRSSARLARWDDKSLVREREGDKKVEELLAGFLGHAPQPVSRPRELAERMARLTHMIRDIIVKAFEEDRASELMRGGMPDG